MYKIHVLNNDDFDSLPITATRGSDISQSLGFANKFTGNAFVRYTGIHDLDKYLVNHELEELTAAESTHEDGNGIRHKSLGDAALSFFLPPVGIPKNIRKQKKKAKGEAEQFQRDEESFIGQQVNQRVQSLGQKALGGFQTSALTGPATSPSPNIGGPSGGGVVGSLGGGGSVAQLGNRNRNRFGFFQGRNPNF